MSSICRIDAICIISATAQNLPVADRAKRKVSAVGCKNRRTKTTSAAHKIASVSKSGENAIPGTGAKRTLHPKNRYKISARLKWLQDEEVKRIEISDALQDVLVMQPAVMVGLISMMTGSALQEDIAATTRALLSKGQDILGRRLWSHNDHYHDENQTGTLSGTAAPCAAPL